MYGMDSIMNIDSHKQLKPDYHIPHTPLVQCAVVWRSRWQRVASRYHYTQRISVMQEQ